MSRPRNLWLAALATCAFPACAAQTLEDWDISSQRWLEAQVTPNRAVPAPDATRRRLLVSYGNGSENTDQESDHSYTYDDALGAISFVMSGERDAAAYTLDALARLIRADGSLWFTYSTTESWPDETDHDSAMVRAGAVGWVGYAFAFYLAHTPPCAPDNSGCVRQRASLEAAAARLAAYLVSLEATEPENPAHGLLRQGYGNIHLVYHAEKNDVLEDYEDVPARGFSTENNISSWFFLHTLGQVTGDSRWSEAADRIRAALLRVAWDEDLGQFDQGFTPGGQRDSIRALDCASWGTLFLIAIGETGKAQLALRHIDQYYASRDGSAAGYRPYFDDHIFPGFEVGKFYFPENPRKQWRELPLVWSEGSLGVALAYLRMGQADRARQIIDGLRTLRVGAGGMRYASRPVPHQMTDAPSVAGAAWLVFLAEALKGNPVAEQFWK
jgi:hypothetical protein